MTFPESDTTESILNPLAYKTCVNKFQICINGGKSLIFNIVSCFKIHQSLIFIRKCYEVPLWWIVKVSMKLYEFVQTRLHWCCKNLWSIPLVIMYLNPISKIPLNCTVRLYQLSLAPHLSSCIEIKVSICTKSELSPHCIGIVSKAKVTFQQYS